MPLGMILMWSKRKRIVHYGTKTGSGTILPGHDLKGNTGKWAQTNTLKHISQQQLADRRTRRPFTPTASRLLLTTDTLTSNLAFDSSMDASCGLAARTNTNTRQQQLTEYFAASEMNVC